jgi:sarcosine oxidase/L-pipecolate oxidase
MLTSPNRLSQSPTADWLIAPHPLIAGIHVATAGSAHAWKFLPTIGDLVVDSMAGCLPVELMEKWAWGRKGVDGGNAPRMKGQPVELRDVIRTRSQSSQDIRESYS